MTKETNRRITEQEFFDQYSGYAMELQQRYGIPASVILAQMSVESDYGNSGHAREGKNFFGVKAGKSWNGPVRYSWDDEEHKSAFRVYGSWKDSMNDYARLMMTSRYNWCGKYASTDHENWIKGIKSSGYCTSNNYVTAIEARIKKFHLDRYDQMAVADAKAKGITIGYDRGQPLTVSAGTTTADNATTYTRTLASGAGKNYAFPIDGDLVVTSGYGDRTKPNALASRHHLALDIRANRNPVYATEDNGKVLSVNQNSSLPSGKYIKVRYDRADGTSYDVTYMHLHEVKVRSGETVSAGQAIGISGNTGNTTGPHLHFAVTRRSSDGKTENLDPSMYLAEIAVLGGINNSVRMRDSGKDLLAEYKSHIQVESPKDMELNLLTEERREQLAQQFFQGQPQSERDMISSLMEGDMQHGAGDFISDMISMAFSAVVALAIQLEHGQFGDEIVQEEQAKDQVQQNSGGGFVIDRSKDVDIRQAVRETALAFDAEYPENLQSTGVRLS